MGEHLGPLRSCQLQGLLFLKAQLLHNHPGRLEALVSVPGHVCRGSNTTQALGPTSQKGHIPP